jgi:4-amino-4-deoxy-L-arabinose transferase-like glycosyltransferase
MSTLLTPLPNRQRIASAWIAVVLALLAFALVLATLDDPGVTWDEPRSFKASRGYMAWLGILKQALLEGHVGSAFDDAVIVRWWVQDPALELHPPLSKLAAGLGWALFSRAWGNIPAYRFSAAVWFAILIAVLHLSVAETYGSVAGVAASLSLLLMPRMFLHAHLANMDMPIATLWVLNMCLFWRAISRQGWLWTILSGLVLGLALGVKLNAGLIPIVWGIWFIFWRREKSVLVKIAVMGSVGLVTFIAIWPWLYYDTLARLAQSIAMGDRSSLSVQYYLGRTGIAPWHYPFVLTFAVVPLTITLACFVGVAQVLRTHARQPLGCYILLNALVPLVVPAFSLRGNFSGERHLTPVFCYLAMLAGIGFVYVLRTLEKRLLPRNPTRRMCLQKMLVVGLAVLLFAPPVVSVVQLHPYELSYYNEFVGGLRGAVRVGLETTYWCESYKGCLPYLNGNLPEGASIWVDQPFALRAYQEDNLLRQDLRPIGWDVISPYSCDYALVQMRETGFAEVPELVDLMKQYQPEFTVSVDGVPLAMVYRIH